HHTTHRPLHPFPTRRSSDLGRQAQHALDLIERADAMARLPAPIVPVAVRHVGEEAPAELARLGRGSRTARVGTQIGGRKSRARRRGEAAVSVQPMATLGLGTFVVVDIVSVAMPIGFAVRVTLKMTVELAVSVLVRSVLLR